MAHLEKLFELQKEEFRNRAEMYRTKMTKMFTGIIEGKSFEERIHEFWDDWSIPHRIEFLNVAFSKIPLPDYERGKHETILAMSCPEIRGEGLNQLVDPPSSISTFLQNVVDYQENEKNYPFASTVSSSIQSLLENLNYQIFADFKDSPKNKQYTDQLIKEQRRMYISMFATMIIDNFCSEFTGQNSLEQKKLTAKCAHCSSPLFQPKRCARCKKVQYCNRQCQENNWPSHKATCRPPSH